jgi:hypothetical protein
MDKHTLRHNEKQINIAILTMIGGIVAFCITQYISIHNENCQRENERQQTIMAAILNDRLVIYKDACKSVGEIMGNVEINSQELDKSMNDFDKIYFGEMSLIEDSKIIASAKNFRVACKLFLQSKRNDEDKKILRDIAVKFTNICKETSIKNWEDLKTTK